jgi:hypothetical protein
VRMESLLNAVDVTALIQILHPYIQLQITYHNMLCTYRNRVCSGLHDRLKSNKERRGGDFVQLDYAHS